MTTIPQPEFPLKYRKDIDGLRAVAVLSVVLYHLGLPVPGGFVGVDIFFTISGFLIGSIILQQTADGIFTFAGFYERRVRRIFPALLVMLSVSLVLAYRYLLPIELVAFSKSLVAASISISNVFFWLQSGYFDAPASETPLLHTWSLAIEEQFYVVLPVLLVVLHRCAPRRINLAIGLSAAISLAISIYGAYRFPSSSFYLLHTRAWELLAGTILALKGVPKICRPMLRHAAGIIGLTLIAVPLLLYHNSTPFPGLAAVPPCLGAALIIAAGENGENVIGRLLSLRPVVFIGLISYSLYLWHWPLIVFYKFGFTIVDGLSRHQSQALLLALSIILASASWRFIELPIRRGTISIHRSLLFRAAAFATVVVAVGSGFLVALNGVPSRFNQQARAAAAYIGIDATDGRRQIRYGTCFISSETASLRDFQVERCMPDRPEKKRILILGDSHAAALWWGFQEIFPGINVMQATASGCKPVLHQRPRQNVGCSEIMNYVLTQYLPSHQVDAVLIQANWDDGDLTGLGETISWLQLKGVPVFVLGPIVEYDSSLPRLLALSISEKDPLLPQRHLERFVEPLDRQMAATSHNTWHVPYISMFDMFCSRGSCIEYGAPGMPLQYDHDHLSRAGSVLAAQKVAASGVLRLANQ